MSINWKKSLIVLCDIVIATYLVLAVTSFNKPDVAAAIMNNLSNIIGNK